jgi:hypothetical protein
LKRRVLLLVTAVTSSVVGFVPTAEAIGGAVCTISGTITFSPPPSGSAEGLWRIGPAAISCQGALNGYHFYGQGPFGGSGSYTGLPAGGGDCLHHVGTGTVDYIMRTGAMVHHIRESKQFTLAGAGKFATPSLKGSLALAPPFAGDCVTKPVTQATFVAQGAMPKTAPFFLPVEDAP